MGWPASPSRKAAGPCHGGAGDDECYWEWEVSTPDEMGDRVSCPSHKLADSGHSRPRLLLLVGLESADSDITTYTDSQGLFSDYLDHTLLTHCRIGRWGIER